jgi:endonuclease YncB( thermonuclease family)
VKRLLAILLLLAVPALADSRTWTDASGKHKSTAELSDFQGGVAYLRKDDGKIAAVPLAKLSKADQEFIKSATPTVQVIEGKVVSIADGDTLTVLEGREQFKIRLEGIDAPEGHQSYGNKSKEALAQKVLQRTARIEWREHDRYGRTVGQVFVDSKWVNREMVKDGWAWHYREYSKSEVLADAESDARTARVGLWVDKDPIPPWEFRRPVASEPPAAPPAQRPQGLLSPPVEPDTPEQKEETVYVTKTGAKYHQAGCRHLKSSIPMSLSEAAKRYGPCSVCHPPEPKEKQASTSTPAESRAIVSMPKTSAPATVDRNPNGEQSTGQTATGIPTYTGPRGGQYHYSKSGKKVYERRKR